MFCRRMACTYSWTKVWKAAVESFPASFIARKFHFEKQDYLALELATERGMPDISFSPGQEKEDKEDQKKWE